MNSFACLLANMCPAPVKNASRTGAVRSGKGDSGAAGSKAKKRDSHLIAASFPPSSTWFDGLEAKISATSEIIDCTEAS